MYTCSAVPGLGLITSGQTLRREGRRPGRGDGKNSLMRQRKKDLTAELRGGKGTRALRPRVWIWGSVKARKGVVCPGTALTVVWSVGVASPLQPPPPPFLPNVPHQEGLPAPG